MSFTTSLLTLLVLGGAGYGAYLYLDDSRLMSRLPGQSPERWTRLKEMAKGRRYVIYLEANGPKGFDPIVVFTHGTTNSLAEAKKNLSKNALSLADEAKEVADGKISSDVLRGITSETVGIYDVLMNRVVEKYEVRIEKARKNPSSGPETVSLPYKGYMYLGKWRTDRWVDAPVISTHGPLVVHRAAIYLVDGPSKYMTWQVGTVATGEYLAVRSFFTKKDAIDFAKHFGTGSMAPLTRQALEERKRSNRGPSLSLLMEKADSWIEARLK
jgi:hypothetical protein